MNRSQNSRIKYFVAMGCLGIVAGFVGWVMLYNNHVDFARRMEADKLGAFISIWDKSGRPARALEDLVQSNEVQCVTIFSTNLVSENGIVRTIIKVEDVAFRNKGYLVAGTDLAVYWVDMKGRASPVLAPLNETE